MTQDPATRIGEVIGGLIALGVYCLMTYCLYLGLH
jgi:hypothetical protein